MKKLIISLLIFISSTVFAGWTRVIGDIEGLEKRWTQLMSEGIIYFDKSGDIFLKDGYSLSFEGDLMKRGPFGVQTIDYVLRLMKKYNTPESTRVRNVLGNHDLNTVSLVQWMPLMSLGEAPDFNAWLQKNQRQNDFISRIDYWAEYNGVFDKIHWYWTVKVAQKLGQDPLSDSFKSTYYPDKKPITEKLEAVISKKEIYSSFYNYVKPGGTYFSNLYPKSKIIDLYRTKEGVSILSFHSGVLSQGNFGIVPGDGMYLFERAARHYFPDQADTILAHVDFNNIEAIISFEKKHPGFTRQALELWVDKYNEFFNSSLKLIETESAKFLKTNNSAEKLNLANSLYTNRLAALADAGWDPVTGKLMVEANSLVYPGSRVVKGSSLPGLPEKLITQILTLAKIDYVTSGHQPVGDGMIHRIASHFGKVVQFLLTDTSFSPIEQEDRVQFSDDGALDFKTKTRDGLDILIQRPGFKEEEKLKSLIDRYSSLSEEHKAKMSLEARQSFEEKAKRFHAHQKLGMMSNGWLIIGFASKTNQLGQAVPDYNNFVVFQKQGRNMVYKTVDTSGISGSKLEYAYSDLSEMAQNARLEKIADLKKHGKTPISLLTMRRSINDADVVIISGPAMNSLKKALKAPEAQAVLEDYKLKISNWLKSLPTDSKTVVIVGGTQGFESEITALISEHNKSRSTPIEMIAGIAGVSGGAEFDKSVQKFMPLNKAFYWDDYFTELLPLLSTTKFVKPKSLQFIFAGGGPIVGKQIRETLDTVSKGLKATLAILPGLSASTSDPEKMSAADLFLASETGKNSIRQGIVSVVSSSTDAIGKRTANKFVPANAATLLPIKNKTKNQTILKCESLL